MLRCDYFLIGANLSLCKALYNKSRLEKKNENIEKL